MGSGFQHLKTRLQHTKGSYVHRMTVTGASASNRGSEGCDVAYMLRESTLIKCNGKISIIVLNCCVSKSFLSDPRRCEVF